MGYKDEKLELVGNMTIELYLSENDIPSVRVTSLPAGKIVLDAIMLAEALAALMSVAKQLNASPEIVEQAFNQELKIARERQKEKPQS